MMVLNSSQSCVVYREVALELHPRDTSEREVLETGNILRPCGIGDLELRQGTFTALIVDNAVLLGKGGTSAHVLTVFPTKKQFFPHGITFEVSGNAVPSPLPFRDLC